MHREKLDLTYARWKEGRKEGEVDLVLVDSKRFKPMWGVEVKWSNRFVQKPQELKSLITFCKSNKISAGLITSIDELDNQVVQDIHLTFIPVALYCYNVGDTTLKLKSNNSLDWPFAERPEH